MKNLEKLQQEKENLQKENALLQEKVNFVKDRVVKLKKTHLTQDRQPIIWEILTMY